jgi:hypothetical protein
MEIDISIRNATPQELQRLFAKFEVTEKVNKTIPARVLYQDRGTGSAPVTLPKGALVNTLVMKKTGNRYSNKWGIPIDSVKEPAKYEYARKICKRFGKPYAEAIKLKGAEDAGAQKMPSDGIPAKGSKSGTKPKIESCAAVPNPLKKKNNRKEQSHTKLERIATANKLQIPFDWKTQKQEYQKAWYLCKKYHKPYPEALALSLTTGEVKKRGKRGKRTGRVIPCPYCQKEYISYGMHMHVKGAHPEKYDEFMKDPDRLHHGIHSGGETGSADGGHKTASGIKTEPAPSLSNSDKIVTGIRVIQSKPVDGKLFFGIGTVTARTGDLVTIRNGPGKKYTLDVQNLEIATGPEKNTKRERLPFHLKKDAPAHNVATTAATEDTVNTFDGEDPEHGRFRDEDDPEAMSSPPEADVKIAGSGGLSDIMPESAPTNSDRRNAHLKSGDKVKHTSGSQLFFGTGTVKRINLKSSEVMVDFGNGIEWLPEKELTLVTA